jgi:hypothetical protein
MFEVWQEVSVELERENVSPVSPDLDCLTEMKRMFEERTASIISSQRELLQNQTEQDLTEEQACYSKVKIVCLQIVPTRPFSPLRRIR